MARPTSIAELDAYVNRLAREHNEDLLKSDTYKQWLFGEELRLQEVARDLDKREENLTYREGWQKNRHQALGKRERQVERHEEAVQGRAEAVRRKEVKFVALEMYLSEEKEEEITRALGHTPTLKDIRIFHRNLFGNTDTPQQEAPVTCEPDATSKSPSSPPISDTNVQNLATAATTITTAQDARPQAKLSKPTALSSSMPPAAQATRSTGPLYARYPPPPCDAAGIPSPYPPVHPRTGEPIPNYNPNSFDPANNPWAPNPRLYFD